MFNDRHESVIFTFNEVVNLASEIVINWRENILQDVFKYVLRLKVYEKSTRVSSSSPSDIMYDLSGLLFKIQVLFILWDVSAKDLFTLTHFCFNYCVEV